MTPKEYIDLYLEKIGDNGKPKQLVLGEILEQSQAGVIVILGAPGSGKSSILAKYQSEMADIAELMTVKHFIKLDKPTDKPILLLDGLDEFRSTSTDKVFVINELGSKISKLKDKRIVVTCREMDWYGEDDSKALKDEIQSDVDVYRVLPLSYDKQIEFASKLGLDEPKVFVGSLTEKGLISNPQMLGMMADIFKEDRDLTNIGKGELYRRYVLYAREQNRTNKLNGVNILSEDEIFKLGGYLAMFYVFSNIDTFDESVLDGASNVDCPLDKLNIVLKSSKLFLERKFSHRTIAEFLAGNYIAKYLLEASDGIGIERVKALFVSEDKIPTELRGAFAWLCSISKNPLLIQIDPYYQAVHGDNSLFDIGQKREIVLSVRQYAEKDSPYFYKFNHSLDLQGFYDSRLEEFFAAELQDAVCMQNHYIYFICAILKGASELGNHICTAIKQNIIDSSVADYYRDNLIYALNNEADFLLEVLNKIKDGELDDDNDHLKEALLNKLYPDVVDSKSVSQYLQLYHTERGGGCYFLMKTPYSEKKDLVDEIHTFSVRMEQDKKHLIIHYALKQFVDEYFLETALMYEDALSAEAIYATLKYFKSKYYDDYDSIEFDRFGWSLKQKINDEKMQKLANELFGLYVKDTIGEGGKRYHFYEFNRLFGLQAPNNQYETLLSFMDERLDKQINEDLFFAALSYSKRDENNIPIDIERIKKIAKQFALDDRLKVWLNPPKTDWQIENEKEMAERAKKDKETLEANDAHFAARSDEDIQGSFDDLYWFSSLVYFGKEKTDTKLISADTYNRLKKIFKNAIFAELIEPELLTIEQLARNKSGRRNIDRVYYASLALNNEEDVFGNIPNNSFFKYLYISSLLSSHIGNINRSNFHERVNDGFAIETLREYIERLVFVNLPDIADMVIKYTNATDNLDVLKTVAMTQEFNNTGFDSAFFGNFLDAFNFGITKEDLTKLKKYAEGNNKTTIEALEYFANDSSDVFSMSMAVAMYEIFTHNNFYTFKNYEKRAVVVSKMMEAFNTEESIKSVNGTQSQKNMCASFLSHDVLKVLRPKEWEVLLKNHQNDIWTNRIKNAIDDDKQQKADANGYGKLDFAALREFLQSQAIVSVEDFFADVCIRLQELIKKIEDNRDNEKNLFYSDSKPKDENECRDAITNILSHAYKDEWHAAREKHEADNRADINIKYKKNDSYEIQIECKKDGNSEIYTGIEQQLIGKYFSSNVQHGIYLVFYFGDKKNKDELRKKLDESIPHKFKNKIKIILLDLTK